MRRAMIMLLCAPLTAFAAEQAALAPSQVELAAAEHEFATQGLRDGVQKSFRAHFASDAIVLKPLPTAAIAWYDSHADAPGRLIWAPQFVAVSGAGDLGLSSGPWRFEAERDGKPVHAHGHFFSIWQRGSEGRWQVLFDHGVDHAAPSDRVEDTALASLSTATGGRLSASALAVRRQALALADDRLRSRLAQMADAAYAQVTGNGTLWLRDGLAPVHGAKPPAAGDGRTVCGCGPRVRLGVAASGDFGYSIGGNEAERAKGADARVWRFEPRSGWTLLADLAVVAD